MYNFFFYRLDPGKNFYFYKNEPFVFLYGQINF